MRLVRTNRWHRAGTALPRPRTLTKDWAYLFATQRDRAPPRKPLVVRRYRVGAASRRDTACRSSSIAWERRLAARPRRSNSVCRRFAYAVGAASRRDTACRSSSIAWERRLAARTPASNSVCRRFAYAVGAASRRENPGVAIAARTPAVCRRFAYAVGAASRRDYPNQPGNDNVPTRSAT